MIEIRKTAEFETWYQVLRDKQAQWRILARIRRLQQGNPGDVKSIGDGVSEMRIDYGPGYRLYFTKRDASVVVLLCAGDKSSQKRDVIRAKHLAKEC